MEPNVVENISNNYCSMYNCWEIKKELAEVVRRKNARKFCILKKLVNHFGQIIDEGNGFFKGELGLETHYRLLKEIESKLFVKPCSRKKYQGSDDIWLTFVVYS